MYRNCAVRNERYRFINNNELYDVKNDPGETQNIASENQEVVAQMRKVYDQWWSDVRPFMVNENVPLAKERPFWVDYKNQEESHEIKDWVRPNLD